MVIAGATATGKTSLGIALGQRLAGAEIVSADSRQVYRGMDIGTAKATAAERAAVVHHGLDLVDPDQRFTAADFRVAALAALVDIGRRDGIGLLVGGTGLYLRTVARGLPLHRGGTDATIREELEARLARDGLRSLVLELEARDPDGASSVDRRNPRRVVRALERALVGGSAVPPAPEGYPAPVAWLGLTLEPDEHRRRIRARVDEQFESGLLAEAARLRERFPEDLPAFSAMGYREAFDVHAGRTTVEEARSTDATRTWAYARRQRTWFRSEPGITWLPGGSGAETVAAALEAVEPWLERIGRADYAGGR